jgi:predicted lipoprotein with Yx(FWY)xxD motif
MRLLTRFYALSRYGTMAAPIGGFALLAAACGSAVYGSASGSSAAATPTNPPAAAGSAPDYAVPAAGGGARPGAAGGTPAAITVKATSTSLGALLTDGQGKTLYLFEKDQPGMSACTGACLGVWPAFTVTGPVEAGSGVSMSMLSTIQRPDGTAEVTYSGHPLYYYVGDGNPGDTNGQGLNQFGAAWYVVSTDGSKIDNG